MINEILKAIKDVVETAYPDKKVLADPVTLENNPTTYLQDGFSVNAGDATARTLGYKNATTIDRTVNIPLTKVIYDSDLVSDSRLTVEKDLIAEALDIIQKTKQDPTVRKLLTDIDWTSDDGINFMEAEKAKFLATTISFTITYNEFYY